MSPLGWALALAEMGYPVLPIRRGVKVPACQDGSRCATTDPDRLVQLFDRAVNVAVLPPRGALVLDCDTAEAVKSMLRLYSELADAPTVATPRGGAHFYVRVSVYAPLTARVGALPGVDLRGLGRAYVLVPPSATSSGSYRWVTPLVAPSQLPEASAALRTAISRPFPYRRPTVSTLGTGSTRYGWSALWREVERVASAPVGSRNDVLNRAAFNLGQLVAAGHLGTESVGRELSHAARRCGLPCAEARATIRSGLGAGGVVARGGRAAGSPRGARAAAGFGGTGSVSSRVPTAPAAAPDAKREVRRGEV